MHNLTLLDFLLLYMFFKILFNDTVSIKII
jgi:hypothetical protein